MMAAVCAGIFPAPCPSWASAGCDVDRLLAAAHSRDLHEARYWHILMHYEQKLSGIVSQVDDPDFFLAPDGKTNPSAELDATIAYLFADSADTRDPDTTDPDAGSGPKQQEKTKKPICRFYARYGWLEKKLGDVMPACFAGRSCPAIDRIEPEPDKRTFRVGAGVTAFGLLYGVASSGWLDDLRFLVVIVLAALLAWGGRWRRGTP